MDSKRLLDNAMWFQSTCHQTPFRIHEDLLGPQHTHIDLMCIPNDIFTIPCGFNTKVPACGIHDDDEDEGEGGDDDGVE